MTYARRVDRNHGVTLRIPRRLVSPNIWQGRHWRVKHRLTETWEAEVLAHAALARGRSRTVAEIVQAHLGGGVPQKQRVSVERQVPSRRNFIRDDDNLRFCVKPLLDALKRSGYIRDDSRAWLELPTPTQAVSEDGKDWTVIRIEPVTET